MVSKSRIAHSRTLLGAEQRIQWHLTSHSVPKIFVIDAESSPTQSVGKSCMKTWYRSPTLESYMHTFISVSLSPQGTEFCGTAGFDVLAKKLREGKQMCKDFEEYMEKRSELCMHLARFF